MNASILSRLSAIILAIFFLCPGTTVWAGLADVETAILKGDYAGARGLADDVLANQPQNQEAQKAKYYIGLSQLRQAQYKEALESFNKIKNEKLGVQLRERVYLGLFDAYYLLEEYQEADAALQELLKEGAKPEAMSLIYFKLAKVNMKFARWSQATDYLEKIVRSFPNSLEVPAAKQLLEEKHYFAVQVGAFMERRLAEALVDELKQKEEYAYIIESGDSQNRKFYRVRVGQLAMLKEAQALKNRLAKFGYPAQIYP
ncbi:MAG: SPOR domain-containing protein [Candidatus Omnitrophica bacterium]|nr:SPOR domain-containing protein [Candidatus Omnitrophota bacterium]